MVFVHSSYEFETNVTNVFLGSSTNAITAIGLAQWNTSDDTYSPFLGGGFFGSFLVEEVPGFRDWDVGPALGVGLQWEWGRLMLHYQHSVTSIRGVQNAAGFATLAVHL